jgi:hypothetical protein
MKPKTVIVKDYATSAFNQIESIEEDVS